MRYAACVLIENNGKFLAVSRKDNPNDFGLPGGKVDLGETIAEGAIRECFEETGFTPVLDECFVYAQQDGDFMVHTFVADFNTLKWSGTAPNEQETGIVEWVSADTLMQGSFGEYNKNALLHFCYIKKYLIWYIHDRHLTNPPEDVIYATSKVEAIKKFLISTAGQYYVHHVEEIE